MNHRIRPEKPQQTLPPPLRLSQTSPFYGLAVAFGGIRPRKRKKTAIGTGAGVTVALGIASVSLYILLYSFQEDVIRFAELTRTGAKIYFPIPVIVALVFSLVHGAFTDNFWRALGVKAKR